ncbi:protein ImuA [Nitrospirillum viridazoti]|nr:protein ImuA [Nitrospirillum amazonense]
MPAIPPPISAVRPTACPSGACPRGTYPEEGQSEGALDRQRLLAVLREQVRAVEAPGTGRGVVPLGVPAVDAHLPAAGPGEGGAHGLPRAALHEVVAAGDLDAGAATAFTALLAVRLAEQVRGPILWMTRAPDLYAPGLDAQGVGPGRLVVVHAACEVDLLWAMEEALRCPRVGAVVGEAGGLDLTASRRLHLAAETGGVPGLLLRLNAGKGGAMKGLKGAGRGGGRGSGRGDTQATAAVTRWQVGTAPIYADDSAASAFTGPAWRVELLRCRGGRPGAWTLYEREGLRLEAAGQVAVPAPEMPPPASAVVPFTSTQFPSTGRAVG